MDNQWQYQVRISVGDAFADLIRKDPGNTALKPLTDIFARHDATLKCQFDAFADYVAEAEKQGLENFPLYEWTKATIENPSKKVKYIKSFTIRVGGEDLYSKEIADALEADLRPHVGGVLITQLAKHDTNPANNPQPPARFR